MGISTTFPSTSEFTGFLVAINRIILRVNNHHDPRPAPPKRGRQVYLSDKDDDVRGAAAVAIGKLAPRGEEDVTTSRFAKVNDEVELIPTWNPKQPFINGCFNWMIPNLYLGNGCFTKHPLRNGC